MELKNIKTLIKLYISVLNVIKFIFIAVISIVVAMLPTTTFGIEGLTDVHQRIIALFVFAALMWLTEAMPSWVTYTTHPVRRVNRFVLSGEKNVSVDTNSYSSGASESTTSVEVSVGVSVCRLQVQEIATIKTEIATRLGYYNYIDQNMNEAYRPTIQRLVDEGIINGNEKGELMLTNDMMRVIVFCDRMINSEA